MDSTTTSIDGLLPEAAALEEIAKTMEFAVAGGMAWIDYSEAKDFARRIRKVAEALATRTPAPSWGEEAEAVCDAIQAHAEKHWGHKAGDWREDDEADEVRLLGKSIAAALSSMRPVQEEGSLEPKCAQCRGHRDDLAPGRDPEELCDPCYDDAVAALKPVQKEGVGEDVRSLRVRPEVAAFALLMEERLRANDHKPGWKQDEPSDLAKRVSDETRELEGAVRDLRQIVWAPMNGRFRGGWSRNNPKTGMPEMGVGYERVPEPAYSERAVLAGKEAADVANMAMMVADVCGCLPALASHPEASPPSLGVEELREGIAERIVRDVAELPDRTSPDDWPEAMLVTGEELTEIVREALVSGRSDLEKGRPASPATCHSAKPEPQSSLGLDPSGECQAQGEDR